MGPSMELGAAARQRLQGQRLITLRRRIRKPGRRRVRLRKLMLHRQPMQLRNLMPHRNPTLRRSLMPRLPPMRRPSLRAESRADDKKSLP